MPVDTSTKVFGISDAKISKLTADTAAALTYASAVDVPGIKSLKMSPKFVDKELRGDDAVLDLYSKLEMIEWSFESAKISLDVLPILIGGSVAANGVTPNQSQVYSVLATDSAPYFKLEGKADYTDAGDAHVVLYKCKANKVDYELKDDYAIVSASGKAIGTTKDKKIKEVVINETAKEIS